MTFMRQPVGKTNMIANHARFIAAKHRPTVNGAIGSVSSNSRWFKPLSIRTKTTMIGITMRTMFSKVLMATAIGATSMTAMAVPADAHRTGRKHYHSRSYYHNCRHSSATTGAVAGGVGGAVIGHEVLGHGLLGVGAGAVAGVVAGKAIDRSLTARRRCR